MLFFFYGTLKRGYMNYLAYVRPMIATNKANYVCEAITIDSLPLTCVTERNIPALWNKPGYEGASPAWVSSGNVMKRQAKVWILFIKLYPIYY